METRRIGSLEVTVTGLGCNNFGWRTDAAASARVVAAALDAGIDFFDTADIYDQGHSEEFLGRALKGRRDGAVVATKFGMKMEGIGQGAKPEYVRQAAESSLRRLGMERIDLYQLHKPDANTPIADTLGALTDLVQEGKVREIGCSNFSVDQLREAEKAAATGARFVSVQNEYSLFHRDPEHGVLAECERQGLAFIPFFPLANGLLTGRYRAGKDAPAGSRGAVGFGPKVFTPENLAKVERLKEFAEARGHTLLELAFSWLASHKLVASVIAGASTPEQVLSNARAADWRMSAAEIAEVERIAGA
ncbi:MAG: aldo/keto reductase [Bryobacteraceae bacterium]|jgi:aryl-alcohol dehydrogenase-like predicted oxidoreductase